MRLRKLVAAAAVATTVAGLGLASAGEASAITADCYGSHMVCLYYNSSGNGYNAVFMQTGNISDYANSYFQSSRNGGTGSGTSVKNNAAAVDSWYSGTFIVYYNSGYNCAVACQNIPAWSTVDLNSALKNNNASGLFYL
ncbi:hypothetical protein ACIQF6_02205 [Kitasatospora sp. NPDC092948]|uniref:hypothetical protein n=1 Tax=Kitasatospora sp. NPDC092948 TaxID=3364088 RepID=UPI0037F34F5B